MVEDLDLTGQVALVTGCTNGIGFETTRVLAGKGATVYATGRNFARTSKIANTVAGVIVPLQLELTDLKSVNACARQIVKLGQAPNIIILNAGTDHFGELELVCGVEMVFSANYLGHFVLVNNLMPSLIGTNPVRVVHVSSDAAFKEGPKGTPKTGIDFGLVRGIGTYNSAKAYAQSKLANALFSLELSDRLQGTQITSNAVHPGSVYSNIAANAPSSIRKAIKEYAPKLKSLGQGAATQVYVATSPELSEVSGKFFSDCNIIEPPAPNFLFDRDLASRLWQAGEDMAGKFLRI